MKSYQKINKEARARYARWHSLGVEYRKKNKETSNKT